MSPFQAWCQCTEFFWAFVFCRTSIRTANAKQEKRKEERGRGKNGEKAIYFRHLNLIQAPVHETKGLTSLFSRLHCALPWCGLYDQALC